MEAVRSALSFVSANASRLAAIALLVPNTWLVAFDLTHPTPFESSTEYLRPFVLVITAFLALNVVVMAYRLWSTPTRWRAAIAGAIALFIAHALFNRSGNVFVYVLGFVPLVLCALAWSEPRVIASSTRGSLSAAAPMSAILFALASLVFGLWWLFGIGSVLAIIFGTIAQRRIAASGGSRGSGIATAGTDLGWVGVAATVIGIIAVAA